MFEIVNFVNMVRVDLWEVCRGSAGLPRWRLMARPVLQAYRPLRTFIALVGVEVWSSGDQINVTPPAGANLDAFMKWRNDELLNRKKHDNAHLIRWETAARLGGWAAAVAMETLTPLVAFQRDRL